MAFAPPRTGHSGLGASGMARWLRCPGSYRLSQRVFPRRASIWAAMGTLAHDLIEQVLLTGDRAALHARRGECVVLEGHEIHVDAALIAGVELMCDYVETVRDDYDEMLVEHTVELDALFPANAPPPEPLYGRADVLLLGSRELEVVDFKNGHGAVPTEDNPQLYYYALGALLAAQDRDIERVRMTIVQPNADTHAKIRTIEIATIDLLLWADEVLIPAVGAVEDRDAPVVIGAWCRFCPALPVCPQHLEQAQHVAQSEFAPVVEPEGQGAWFAKHLELAERVTAWAAALHEGADEFVRQGRGGIPGWGLVPKRAARQWADEEVATELVVRELSNLQPDLLDRAVALRSPAQVEKIIARDAPDTWSRLQPLIERVSAGDKLARVHLPEGAIPL